MTLKCGDCSYITGAGAWAMSACIYVLISVCINSLSFCVFVWVREYELMWLSKTLVYNSPVLVVPWVLCAWRSAYLQYKHCTISHTLTTDSYPGLSKCVHHMLFFQDFTWEGNRAKWWIAFAISRLTKRDFLTVEAAIWQSRAGKERSQCSTLTCCTIRDGYR